MITKINISHKYYVSTVCLIMLALYSCHPNSSNEETGELTVIKFEESDGSFRPTDELSNITCVQLEMTDESILGEIKKVVDAEGNLVVLTADNEIAVFNREDGKYIRHLGAPGEGPEEYIAVQDIFYESGNGIINAYDRVKQEIVSYKLSGEFVKKRKLPRELRWIESMESNQEGTILACNKLTGVKPAQEFAFTLISPDGEYENFDSFAPVTVDGFVRAFSKKPMSVCGNEMKLVKFLSDTLFSIKKEKIEPLYKLDLGKKIVSKKVAADFGYDVEFYRYCDREKLLEGIDKMFETERYILLVAHWESENGYYWLDKETGSGYHLGSTSLVEAQIRKVVYEGSIINPVGYNEKEIISIYPEGDNQEFITVLSEDPEAVLLPESVISAIRNVDPEGNPFLLIYSH